MNLPIRLAFALAFALLVSAPVRAADTVEIKQRWQAGKRYYQTIITEQGSNAEIAQQKIDQSTTTTMEITMTVAPRTAGRPKRMTIRYQRMAMLVTMNGQKMGYDSADPTTSGDALDLAKMLGGIVGKELKVVLNDKDEIVDVENYDEFIKSLASTGEPDFDPGKMFSREVLTQTLRQGGLYAVPEKPVAAGETWPFESQIELPQIGKVVTKGTYTLKGVGDHDGVKCAEIATNGILSMQIGDVGGGGTNDAPLTEIGVKATGGAISGSIWFDPQLGFARDTHLVQEMTISMKNLLDDSGTVSMPVKQTIDVKLTKVEDVK